MSKKVLLTRPNDDSQELAKQIAARGYDPVIAPMLEIVPLEASFPDFNDYGGFVFTSANAVKTIPDSVFDRLPKLQKPVYALAARTGQTLPWFAQYAITAEGGADDLSARIAQDLEAGKIKADKPLLHICGVDVRNPVTVAGLTVEQFPVYKADAAREIPEDVRDAIRNGEIYAVTFFSARTAETFVSLCEQYGLPDALQSTKALCLADSMVKSVRVLQWQGVQVAKAPNRDDLLALLK